MSLVRTGRTPSPRNRSSTPSTTRNRALQTHISGAEKLFMISREVSWRKKTIKYPSCTPSQRSSPEASERKKCQPTPPDTWAPHPEVKQPCDPTHLSCIQDQVAAKVLHDRIQHVPSIIVAWEHTNIKHLVHYLADTSKEIEKAVDWPCWEFGRVIDIHYKRWGSGYHYCKTHVFDQSCSACHSHACPHKDCHH